jgi:hypothetical protein
MKTKNIITVLLFTLILASCSSVTTSISPTKLSAPPVTFTISVPSRTPSPTATEVPTQTPSEVPIPAFMDGFIAQGWDKQFEDPARGVNMCYIDYDSIRQTDFMVGDVQILGVYDCYLIDDQSHLQQLSFPLAWDNPTAPKSSPHYGNTGSQQAGDFSLGYMWNSAKDLMMLRRDKYNLYYFQFGVNNTYTNVDPSLQAYWQSALAVVPYVDDNFNAHGIVNLKDFPNAKHFTIPLHINYK